MLPHLSWRGDERRKADKNTSIGQFVQNSNCTSVAGNKVPEGMSWEVSRTDILRNRGGGRAIRREEEGWDGKRAGASAYIESSQSVLVFTAGKQPPRGIKEVRTHRR